MPTERVIEVPWALMQLPQTGVILDVGSCDASYLNAIPQYDRILHCLDPRECGQIMPKDVVFHCQSIIGNDLPRSSFDAVLFLSVLEHIGLPCYDQTSFRDGDNLALAEAWSLLKPGCPVIVTVPAGGNKVVSWYRQYDPTALRQLFTGWTKVEITYWGFREGLYQVISEEEVESYDYRDTPGAMAIGAGALAGIVARRPMSGD